MNDGTITNDVSLVAALEKNKNTESDTFYLFMEDVLLNGYLYFDTTNGTLRKMGKRKKRKQPETILEAMQSWNLCEPGFYTSVSSDLPQQMQEEQCQAFAAAKIQRRGTRAWAPFLPPPSPHTKQGLQVDQEDQIAINYVLQNYLNPDAKPSVVQVSAFPFRLPFLIIHLAIGTISPRFCRRDGISSWGNPQLYYCDCLEHGAKIGDDSRRGGLG